MKKISFTHTFENGDFYTYYFLLNDDGTVKLESVHRLVEGVKKEIYNHKTSGLKPPVIPDVIKSTITIYFK